MAKFTDLCDRLLQDKGMSASKMMKDIGFSSGLYSQWRKGLQNPSAAKVTAIAHYLNVPVSYFYDSPSEPSIIPHQYAQDNRQTTTPENFSGVVCCIAAIGLYIACSALHLLYIALYSL